MGGEAAHDAEVLGGLDEASAEELLPHAVDGHPGGQRIGIAEDPLGQPEAIARGVGGEFAEGRGNLGGDGIALLVIGTTDQDVGHRRAIHLLFLHVG